MGITDLYKQLEKLESKLKDIEKYYPQNKNEIRRIKREIKILKKKLKDIMAEMNIMTAS